MRITSTLLAQLLGAGRTNLSNQFQDGHHLLDLHCVAVTPLPGSPARTLEQIQARLSDEDHQQINSDSYSGTCPQRARVLARHARRAGAVLLEPGIDNHPRLRCDSLLGQGGNRRRTGSTAHGEEMTNCCNCWWSTSKRPAIGCIDMRRPSALAPANTADPSLAGRSGPTT